MVQRKMPPGQSVYLRTLVNCTICLKACYFKGNSILQVLNNTSSPQLLVTILILHPQAEKLLVLLIVTVLNRQILDCIGLILHDRLTNP